LCQIHKGYSDGAHAEHEHAEHHLEDNRPTEAHLKGGFSPLQCGDSLALWGCYATAVQALATKWSRSAPFVDGAAEPKPSAVAHSSHDCPRILCPEPFNFAIPLLGIVDDVFLLPLLLRVLTKFAFPVTRVHIDPRARDERVVSVQ